MENPSILEEDMQVLEAEMLILKYLRYEGDRRLEGWLQDVKGKALDVENLRKELDELKTGIDPNNLNARLELTMKVTEVLKDIRVLKQEGNAHPDSIESLLLELAIEKPKQYSFADLSSFTLNFYNKIGHGASGNVYKGQLPNGVQVAVKVLLEHDVVKEMFMAEVRTMGRTYHRNLIKLYGFCFEENKKALVYEYMENGSLDKVLYENHHSIEWEKLYGIATDIAKGIAYLHDGCYEQIIHHDVKAANVLLDSKFSPKVTDFGSAKLLNRDRSHITLTRIRGTPGYLAPEMWMPSSLVTYKCDVYSFGMLLFEVLGRRNNIQNNNKWFPQQVWDKFDTGHLDEIIDDCGIRENNREKATILSMVAFWCAQFTAQVRPTMSNVVKMLEKEIPVKRPPNPFFASNLVSSLQAPHLPEVSHPKVVASISLQPSHLPEVIHPKVAAISLQPSDMPEMIHPKVVAFNSVQPSDMLEVNHPKVAASISMQPSDLPEVIRPKVDAFISLQPSHLQEVSRPEDAASFLLQSSDLPDMIQAKFGASISTQPSHSRKAIQPKAAHSKDGSLHEKRYQEQEKNSSNKEFASSSTLEPFPKPNRRYQSILPTSWSQLVPKFIVDRKRSSRKTESKHPTRIEKPLGDGNGHDLNFTGAYTGETTAVPTVKEETNNVFFFRNPAQFFDLEMLLTGSSEVLGRGTIGTSYKTVLEVGITVVVKRLRNMTPLEREFKEKIEILGSMDHKNVVPLQAYYCSKDEKLILYHYMNNGSLATLLHGNRGAGRTPLIWKLRLWIAFGAICGIQYLHSRGPSVSHGNIKSSNVLITNDYNGLVSDFGLAELVIHTSSPNAVSGYRAPEVIDIRYVSQKADVYSFGILLLELLTGKPPNSILTEEGIDLIKWVQTVDPEEWTAEVFDIELLRYDHNEEEMNQLLQLAIVCASQEPDKRPTITEVAQLIENISTPEHDNPRFMA